MNLCKETTHRAVTEVDVYKTYSNKELISYDRFKRILLAFNIFVRDELLERSEGFKMPHGLGYIRVIKYKPKKMTQQYLSVDYKTSKEEGKRIYHLNEHSDGYKYRLFWSKIPRTFPDRYKYQLLFVRANKRKLAQLIFNKHDYINIDDIQIYKM